MAFVTPFFLMFLFGAVFGNIADVGDFSYINFIVPGIILQSVGQSSQFSAISVTNDMAKGMVDRFRSMPISKAAVLIAHILASVVKNIITAAVIIGTAFLIGFRPTAGAAGWLVAIGVLLLAIITLSVISVLVGLVARTPESSSGIMFPLFILPFVSSGFAPTEVLPGWLRWFATHQPMSPIIDSTRGLLFDIPVGNSLWLAVAWCVGIAAVAFITAVRVFKGKLV